MAGKIHLSQTEQQAILLEVAAIEQEYDLEIIPMVVESSSLLGRSYLLLLGWLLFLSHLLFFLLLPTHWYLALPLSSFISLVYVLTPIKRLLISKQDQQFQVQLRASTEFFNRRLHHAHRKNGMLFFLSLFEKQVVLFADNDLLEKIGPNLDSILQAMIPKLKLSLTQGLITGLQEFKKCLPESLKLTGKPNLIPDEIIIKP